MRKSVKHADLLYKLSSIIASDLQDYSLNLLKSEVLFANFATARFIPYLYRHSYTNSRTVAQMEVISIFPLENENSH
jgi:hypothetical protein